MKLLLDENISWRLTKLLADIFPQAIHVSSLNLPAPAKDWDIWNYAREHDYALLTNDDDFEAMALLRGSPPKVILLRAGNLSTKRLEQLIRSRFEMIQYFLQNAEIVLLELY